MGSNPQNEPSESLKYYLRKVQVEEEMDHILEVIRKANYTPYDPIVEIVFPVNGLTGVECDKALAEHKQRLWDEHNTDPSSNWFYVVEATSLKPVGCCQWQIHPSDPFTENPRVVTAPWWPAGERREFCEAILNKIYHARMQLMRKPFQALAWMAVVPQHRRQGIGAMLMRAGIDNADARDLECWIEASAMGKPLYENFGFKALSTINLDTSKDGESEVWAQCRQQLTPPPITTMWRPCKSVQIGSGEIIVPFQPVGA